MKFSEELRQLLGVFSDFKENEKIAALENGSLKLNAEWCATLLRLAAMKNKTKVIKELFEYTNHIKLPKEDYIDIKNKDGHTAIMEAAIHDQAEAFMLLLDAGANLYLCNTKQNTALSLAYVGKKEKVLKSFFARKLKLSYYDKHGNSIIHYALLNNQIDFAKALVDQGTVDINEAQAYPQCTHLNVIPYSKEALTPLLRILKLDASYLGKDLFLSYRAVQDLSDKLLRIGANPNVTDPDTEHSPLILAIYQDEETVNALVGLLLEKNADINHKSKLGHTLLVKVFFRGCSSSQPSIWKGVLKRLLAKGAQPLDSTELSSSSLFKCMRYIDEETVKKIRFSEEMRSKFLHTMHEMLKMMINNCKNLNVIDKFEKKKPLAFAIELGLQQVVTMLLRAGAIPEKKDQKIRTKYTATITSLVSEFHRGIGYDRREKSEEKTITIPPYIFKQVKTVYFLYSIPELPILTELKSLVIAYHTSDEESVPELTGTEQDKSKTIRLVTEE